MCCKQDRVTLVGYCEGQLRGEKETKGDGVELFLRKDGISEKEIDPGPF